MSATHFPCTSQRVHKWKPFRILLPVIVSQHREAFQFGWALSVFARHTLPPMSNSTLSRSVKFDQRVTIFITLSLPRWKNVSLWKLRKWQKMPLIVLASERLVFAIICKPNYQWTITCVAYQSLINVTKSAKFSERRVLSVIHQTANTLSPCISWKLIYAEIPRADTANFRGETP